MTISTIFKISTLTALLIPTLANAFFTDGTDSMVMPPANTPLPQNCVFGRAKPDSNGKVTEVTLQDINQAYQSGKDLYNTRGNQTAQENIADAKAIYDLGNALSSMWEGLQYIRIEGPKYVLQGQNNRFKANYSKIGSRIQFFNNEFGYVGKDKTNIEANAYQSLKFVNEHGAGLVWVSRGDLCSAKGVWVQKPPKIAGGSFDPINGVTVTFEYDRFSKAAIENLGAKINIYAKSQASNTFTLAGSTSANRSIGSVTIKPTAYRIDQGPFTFYAEIDDGKFTSEKTQIGQANNTIDVIAGPAGTKIFEFNDPTRGNYPADCNLQSGYSNGMGNTLYNEYQLNCPNHSVKIGIENTSGTCHFTAYPASAYDIDGLSCTNWRVYAK